ncbi:MAG TPA: hypothetical protein VNW95_15670 [Mucilaginibacter sp.]|jgi:hypothetical protein|nr:hypothetical protein [Mucilaginibacter sp.]
MIKSVFTQQMLLNLSLVYAVLVFCGFQILPKPAGDIILQDERIAINPKEFYIADVIDERENRAAVAWLVPAVANEKSQAKLIPVDLQGGGFAAIKQFIAHNLPRNTALRPVVASLKKCAVTESAASGGLVEGRVSVVMSFDLAERDDVPEGGLHLTDYTGSATYTRNAGQPQDIEPTLRHTLENAFIYLNTWMNRQAATNIKLAKAVKVTFEGYRDKVEGDSIYYSTGRPLTWDDFQSKTSNSRYDAEIYPSMGYDERNTVNNGIVHIHLLLKVYLPKSASWVKDGSRTAYALNHEQRHFDIAKIAAERFKQKVLSEQLPPGNFDGPINVDYLESYREMTDMQKRYDKETAHGSNGSAQARWNGYIDEELRKFGVK